METPKGDQTSLDGLFGPTSNLSPSVIDERARALKAGFGQPPMKGDTAALADAQDFMQREAETMQAAQQDLRELMGANKPAPAGDTTFSGVRVELKADAIAQNAQTAANLLKARKNAAPALDTEMEKRVVELVKAYFEMSHDHISKRYDFWVENEQVHDLYITADAASASATSSRRKKPLLTDTIMTPYSRAISDTICTYNLAIFGGMPAFRLEAVGEKPNRRGAKIIELDLSQSMRRIGYEAKLYQLFLDRNRYGFAPIALFWGKDGNAPMNLDPWACFPDPRVTAQNRHEADFFGYRTWATLSAMRRRNLYDPVKLDELRTSKPRVAWKSNLSMREAIRGQSVDMENEHARLQTQTTSYVQLGTAHILNTLWIFLDPRELEIPAPPGLYRIVVADEEKVVLFDQTPFNHGQIPILVADGDFDAHKTFSSGLYDRLAPLQRFQDWLLRTRVENVQAVVQSRMAVDPTKVNVNDILNPNAARLIRTLPGADPRTALFPIETPDVTRGYWNDLDTAGQLMQRLEAASDTAQGIQSETQKTATEIARLTSLGQQRLGSQARLISAMTMRPFVAQAIDNIQYFGTRGGSVRLPPEFGGNNELVTWGPGDIEGRFDYQIVDGTLPVDPRENVDMIMRAIRILSETGAAGEWNMNRWIEALIESMGFSNIGEFKLTKEEAAKRGQLATNALAQMNASVVPDEKIQQEAQRGNIVPMSKVAPAPAGQPPVIGNAGG